MVKTSSIFVDFLAAAFVAARPIALGDIFSELAAETAHAIGTANAAHSSNGTNAFNNLDAIANQQAAAAAQEADEADKATKAAAAEAAPGVDRQHLRIHRPLRRLPRLLPLPRRPPAQMTRSPTRTWGSDQSSWARSRDSELSSLSTNGSEDSGPGGYYGAREYQPGEYLIFGRESTTESEELDRKDRHEQPFPAAVYQLFPASEVGHNGQVVPELFAGIRIRLLRKFKTNRADLEQPMDRRRIGQVEGQPTEAFCVTFAFLGFAAHNSFLVHQVARGYSDAIQNEFRNCEGVALSIQHGTSRGASRANLNTLAPRESEQIDHRCLVVDFRCEHVADVESTCFVLEYTINAMKVPSGAI
ncbi:hypothetical protein B0H14DRAFT_2613160 [Mycena olivaceomarginata]|nr:hypothetical protein B0H14DRAFT_2613160 [Mycena olivaceomarginata]